MGSNSTYQYEPLPVPSNWKSEEKRFIARLTDVLDDIYLKWGRIGEKELSETVTGKISSLNSDGGLKKDGKLSADVIEAITAKIEKVLAEEITTDRLYVALAEITKVVASVLEVNYAKIVDANLERVFIESGTAGKFRADNLEVIQSQIVDLFVDSFRMVSEDGKVYAIKIDAEGNLTTEYLYDESEWMEDGEIPDGYHAVASSMTVGEVTAGTLFVTGEAAIMKLTAQWLGADEAWINTLVTGLIKSDLGAQLNLESNEAIKATVKYVDDRTVNWSDLPPEEPEAGYQWGDTGVSPAVVRRWLGLDVPADRNVRVAMEGNPVVLDNSSGWAKELEASASFGVSQSGSGDASPDNICPIRTLEGVSVTATGKNLIGAWEQGNINSTTGADADASNIIRCGYVPVTPGVTYAISRSIAGGSFAVRGYGADKNYLGGGDVCITLVRGASATNPIPANGYTAAFTVNAGVYYLRFIDYTADLTSLFQMEAGTESTDYEPYQATELTCSFDAPVPAAEVDFAAGVWRETWKYIVLDGTEAWQKNTTRFWLALEGYTNGLHPVLSDRYRTAVSWDDHLNTTYTVTLYKDSSFSTARLSVNYSDFGSVAEWTAYLAAQYAAGTPVTIAYKLAEPVEHSFEPQEPAALKGVNVLNTDADELTLTAAGSGWETVNDQAALREYAETRFEQTDEEIRLRVRQSDLEVYVRFDADGLHVGRVGDYYSTRVTNESFDVLAGSEMAASFRDGLIIMGGWAIRQSTDGGLVQSRWEG